MTRVLHSDMVIAAPSDEGRVRFGQSERFTGILEPLILRFIAASTQQGFAAMNQALKEQAEAAAERQPVQAA